MRCIITWCSMLLFLAACTKEPLHMERKAENSSTSLSAWLINNCDSKVVEPTTGTLAVQPSEVRFDGMVIDHKGLYFFAEQVKGFPTLKEIAATGAARDVLLGSSNGDCPFYTTAVTTVNLRVFAGEKMLSLVQYPVVMMQHETVTYNNWKVVLPKNIDMFFRSRK